MDGAVPSRRTNEHAGLHLYLFEKRQRNKNGCRGKHLQKVRKVVLGRSAMQCSIAVLRGKVAEPEKLHCEVAPGASTELRSDHLPSQRRYRRNFDRSTRLGLPFACKPRHGAISLLAQRRTRTRDPRSPEGGNPLWTARACQNVTLRGGGGGGGGGSPEPSAFQQCRRITILPRSQRPPASRPTRPPPARESARFWTGT